MTDSRQAVERARAADHVWPSNHVYGMPDPCGEILTEWLYPMAEDVLALAAALADTERERDEAQFAHRALDDFDVPRDEPHFHSPYKLSGRIRWLRSKLVIEANQERGAKQAAEARVAELEAVEKAARALSTYHALADMGAITRTRSADVMHWHALREALAALAAADPKETPA